ncbi:MAG: hypothetical protein A2287_07645 [Candidatus Melainabacteria bacterium RIFOXYA12_FULL_32_12]|nr:MAG: hypothetical protein A2255_07675 [Candidatus Melainabacteria bacterium RIFOXYA2_FULL_32_9]OGI30699.1 MAG: hypothetical protein A2287_07645 [Candidatus Melainabacteria bacterium RIFOXYA12_FULL_32_12]
MLVYWNFNLIKIENKSDYQFFDRAFHFGDGVYETIAVKDGKVMFFDEHANRLVSNANSLDIPIIIDIPDLGKNIDNIIKSNKIDQGFIKVIVTRGLMTDAGLSYPKPMKPSLLIWGQKCGFTPLKEKRPYKVIQSQHERRNPYSKVTYTKTLNYLSNIIAKNEADAAGCDEAIFLNTNGNLAEGTTSNIFLIDNNGKIHTPEVASGLLNGVVRSKIILAAIELGFEIEESVISPNKLKHSKGCFLTSTLLDIQPVSEILGVAKYEVSSSIDILEQLENKYQSYS